MPEKLNQCKLDARREQCLSQGPAFIFFSFFDFYSSVFFLHKLNWNLASSNYLELALFFSFTMNFLGPLIVLAYLSFYIL